MGKDGGGVIGVKLAVCELEHIGKQYVSKENAAQFAPASFVGHPLRLKLSNGGTLHDRAKKLRQRANRQRRAAESTTITMEDTTGGAPLSSYLL